MSGDVIVDEVRRARDEHARQFNYDLAAIVRDAQRRQALSGIAVVRREPRPAKKGGDTPLKRPRANVE